MPHRDPHTISFRPSGKITMQANLVGGPIETYVYQRVAKGKGNIAHPGRYDLQLRRHVIPADRQTPLQLAARQRMREAVGHWQLFGPLLKKIFTQLGARVALPGNNYWIRAYLKRNQPTIMLLRDGTTSHRSTSASAQLRGPMITRAAQSQPIPRIIHPSTQAKAAQNRATAADRITRKTAHTATNRSTAT